MPKHMLESIFIQFKKIENILKILNFLVPIIPYGLKISFKKMPKLFIIDF